MTSGAETPEELEAMLEDALIVRDAAAVADLFEEGALLVTGHQGNAVRGRAGISRVMAESWDGWPRAAGPGWVLRAGDIALSVGNGCHVLRRSASGGRRMAISVMKTDTTKEQSA